MITLLEAIIVTQILLETVPVSSSSHILIVKKMFSKFLPQYAIHSPSNALCEILNVPTLFVVAFFFRKNILTFTKHSLRIARATSPLRTHHKIWLKTISKIFVYALYVNLITYTAYMFKNLLGSTAPSGSLTTVFFLTISMLAILSLQWQKTKPSDGYSNLCFWHVTVIGIAQCFSLMPGISRFGATYVAARWLNISPRRSFEFSFLLHAMLSFGAIARALFSQHGLSNILTLILNPTILSLVLIAATLSLAGLTLSWHLATHKKFWYFGLYYPIPITILFVLWMTN